MSTRAKSLVGRAFGVIALALAVTTVCHAALPVALTTRPIYNAWGFFVGYQNDIGPSVTNPLKDVLNMHSFRLSGQWEPAIEIPWVFSYTPPFTGSGIPAATGPGFFTGLEAIANPEVGGHVDTYFMEAPGGPWTQGPAIRFFAGPGDYVIVRNTLTGELITYGPDDIEEVSVVPEPGSLAAFAAMLPMAALLRRRRS